MAESVLVVFGPCTIHALNLDCQALPITKSAYISPRRTKQRGHCPTSIGIVKLENLLDMRYMGILGIPGFAGGDSAIVVVIRVWPAATVAPFPRVVQATFRDLAGNEKSRRPPTFPARSEDLRRSRSTFSARSGALPQHAAWAERTCSTGLQFFFDSPRTATYISLTRSGAFGGERIYADPGFFRPGGGRGGREQRLLGGRRRIRLATTPATEAVRRRLFARPRIRNFGVKSGPRGNRDPLPQQKREVLS